MQTYKSRISSCVSGADFMDSWKISGNDPVWQSLDLKGSRAGALPPINKEDDAIFSF